MLRLEFCLGPFIYFGLEVYGAIWGLIQVMSRIRDSVGLLLKLGLKFRHRMELGLC